MLHREEGPAVVSDKEERWFLENAEVKKENHPWWMAQNEKCMLEQSVKMKKVLVVKRNKDEDKKSSKLPDVHGNEEKESKITNSRRILRI